MTFDPTRDNRTHAGPIHSLHTPIMKETYRPSRIQIHALNFVSIRSILRMLSATLQTQITQWLRHRDEPKITQCRDRKGNLYYQVYDPTTHRSASFGSESEVRWWLEQRYSQ